MRAGFKSAVRAGFNPSPDDHPPPVSPMKKIKKRRLIFQLFIWLLAEIVLGYLEMDNLADYSEYLKGQDMIVLLSNG